MEEIRTQEEIMDFFTRTVVESGTLRDSGYQTGGVRAWSGASGSTTESAELAITDGFGFVEKTLLDLGGAS